MKIAGLFGYSLLAVIAAVLLFAGLAPEGARAQGLGDFSAPPPERVKPKPPPKPAQKIPAKKRKPKPTPKPKRSKPRYEELSWFSRTMLCSGTSQRCEEAATWPMRTDFSAKYYLTLTVPAKYCSPFYLDVELDGRLLGSSGLLGPGRSVVLSLGKLSKGNHALRLSALGTEGGCNRGVLQSWGVDALLSNNPSNRSLAKAPSGVTNVQRTAAITARETPKAEETRTTERREEPPARKPGRKSGAIHVVNVSGRELTGLNAYSLLSSLSLAKDRGARAVAVNLERVNYMTEPGVEALLDGERIFGRGNLALVNLQGEPRRVLEERIPGHFRIYTSKRSAVAALRGR